MFTVLMTKIFITKKLVRDLPKFWSEICQNFGLSFAKKLVRDSPKNWLLIRRDQKIGQRFAKKLVNSFAKILVVQGFHWPKF